MRQEITFEWERRLVRLSYHPRYLGIIDHLEIRSDDGTPLPITETGYKSHFFGPVEPALTIEEAETMVIDWLNDEAHSAEWQTYALTSRQLSLF